MPSGAFWDPLKWGLVSVVVFVFAASVLSGCGGDGALPFTDAKTREFEALSQAAMAKSEFGIDGKAAFEAYVLEPLTQMGYSYDATVQKALEAEKDNRTLLDPLHLTDTQWYYFVRRPLADCEDLLRWGAISEETAAQLRAAIESSRRAYVSPHRE